ncbi:unnamed protein product [Ceutorhynchus assimilis]|uniref:Integrase core domain-containing protein n=1 Tax=Ceutorhynchus assimilis TaxID=467358 RepID=A0A9N9QS47_9CUCU|nr:unnamed protein product [Ceutorhynchus assimilis]
MLRADMGTENGIVENIQCILKTESSNFGLQEQNAPAFIYGTSPANQRIEAWWAILRKHHAQFWLNMFNQLKDDGLFDGSLLDKSLTQLCFPKLIQEELDIVVEEWNFHRIAGSRNRIAPRGRPFLMYYMPQIYGTYDYLCRVNHHGLGDFPTPSKIDEPCDIDIFELASIIRSETGLTLTRDPSKAIELYIYLRSQIQSLYYNSFINCNKTHNISIKFHNFFLFFFPTVKCQNCSNYSFNMSMVLIVICLLRAQNMPFSI